jgi:CheY-like chemotaxis protein/anti-sigma regulatory factor (Ser/Thr protein kinase)
VHADPLLVERILRNLVANAIRYTDDGAVLVGCRRRADRLLLQVWDTGVGIPIEEQSRIFEEFYQVPGRQTVTADQRKGLGLGLAIVARLAALMQAPLAMRSAPGRGTVFMLELSPGSLAAGSEQRSQAERSMSPPTLAGRTLLVVEDDAAVREALEVLLVAWGARVLAHGSAAALRAAFEGAAPAAAPDLLITDYRLETGSTGIDVIAWLRARLGPQLPAVVVTGSATAALELEAQRHDFHLLTKPVVPNKLRAMVAFKLAAARTPTNSNASP